MGIQSKLTIAYSTVQAAFWMDLCIALSFASVYLLGLGYSNSALGMIIASGNLIGAFIGPWLSSLIDRSEKVSAAKAVPPILILRSAMLIILILFPKQGMLTTVGFTLYIAFAMSVNSLNLKLYVDAEYKGQTINYGISRGMGSLAYVLISSLLGILITRTSIHIVPWAAVATGIFQLLAFIAFQNLVPDMVNMRDDKAARGVTIAEFARKNKRFCMLLAGTVLLFFAHNTVCNYLINVVHNIGGSTDEMGLLNGFMALVEIPVMLSFNRFFGKRNKGKLLRIAFVMFTVKAIAIAAASNVFMLGGAFLLQAPSFGLYTAAIVPYVEENIAHEDSAKAQSLAFTMTTFSSVLAGTISGMMYDNITVSATLWVAAAVCAAGTIISVIGTNIKTERID